MRIQKLITLVVALISVSSLNTAAKTDAALALADRLFEATMWDPAITEYRRHLFFPPNSRDVDHCYHRIALCWQRQGDLGEALEWTRHAMTVATSDSVLYERGLDVGVLLAHLGNRSTAELEFTRLFKYCPYSDVRQKAAFLAADLQVNAYRWRDARSSLESATAYPAVGSRLDSLFTSLEATELKSPAKAKRLSTFFPGAGQFYTGNVLSGLHSLGLAVGFGALLVASIADHRIGLSVVSASLLIRYYVGGRHHAYRLAVESNVKKVQPSLNEIKQQLQQIDTDGRPMDTSW